MCFKRFLLKSMSDDEVWVCTFPLFAELDHFCFATVQCESIVFAPFCKCVDGNLELPFNYTHVSATLIYVKVIDKERFRN